jgi:hypothetical protein
MASVVLESFSKAFSDSNRRYLGVRVGSSGLWGWVRPKSVSRRLDARAENPRISRARVPPVHVTPVM